MQSSNRGARSWPHARHRAISRTPGGNIVERAISLRPQRRPPELLSQRLQPSFDLARVQLARVWLLPELAVQLAEALERRPQPAADRRLRPLVDLPELGAG